MKKLHTNTLLVRDRLLVVALVVFAHVVLLWSWVAPSVLFKPAHHEMSVNMDMSSPSPAVPAEPEPLANPMHVEPQRSRVATQAEQSATPVASSPAPSPAVASVAPVQPVAAVPGSPDSEPDYQAAYLNNPSPVYPMAARRMGWQGRVVLNVEVLANGHAGQVTVQQSSGHQVLDEAALQAVRGWKFVAARQGGQAVSRWVLVPMPFILKETE